MNSPVTNGADARYMIALTLTDPSHRMQRAQAVICRRCVHRCLDHPGRYGVHADARRGVLGRQRLRHRGQPALGQRRQGRWDFHVGVLDEGGGDVDHVAATQPLHVLDRATGDVEEPAEVHPVTSSYSSSVYCVNRLATKTPALLISVSMRPKRSIASRVTRSAVSAVAMSP